MVDIAVAMVDVFTSYVEEVIKRREIAVVKEAHEVVGAESAMS